MSVGVEQSPRPGNGNVIRGGLIHSVAQKFPQAQRVGHPPGNAPLAVQPFEESNQHQPEVDARSQRWSAHPVRVIPLTSTFAKLFEARLFQHPFQFPVERMPRSLGHFGAVPQPFLPLPAFSRAHRHNRFYTETSQIGNGFRHRLLAGMTNMNIAESEDHLQGGLRLARKVGLAGYCAKVAVAHRSVRAVELHMVERVDRFYAELQAHSFPNLVDREFFKYREVRVGLARLADPGYRPRRVADRVRGGLHKNVRIRKVLVYDVRTGLRGCADQVWPLTAICRQSMSPMEPQRKGTARNDAPNSVELPTAQYPVHNWVPVVADDFPFSKRQFVDMAELEYMRRVVRRYGFLQLEVVRIL